MVAITVVKRTLASKGNDAICTTAAPTWAGSIVGSARVVPSGWSAREASWVSAACRDDRPLPTAAATAIAGVA